MSQLYILLLDSKIDQGTKVAFRRDKKICYTRAIFDTFGIKCSRGESKRRSLDHCTLQLIAPSVWQLGTIFPFVTEWNKFQLTVWGGLISPNRLSDYIKLSLTSQYIIRGSSKILTCRLTGSESNSRKLSLLSSKLLKASNLKTRETDMANMDLGYSFAFCH